MPARVPVTAVLVAHDGSRWLPEAVRALTSSTVQPARVVAADTGSTDGSGALLRAAADRVLDLPRDTGFAAAVHAALATVPPDTRWIWLLHDDCAPDPDALSALLRAAAADPAAAVLGPKAVDWDDPRVLLEMGCSTDGSGVRDPGVEPGELDQGQHDEVRQVLAVGTAGSLIRRDVWDALGGLDPSLPLFRDDVDLGWRASAAGHRVLVVPQARVRHARAATVGDRPIDTATGGALAVDRRAALHVLLAHTRLLPLVLLRVLLASLLRAAGRLLRRQPRAAGAELAALLALRPRQVQAARRARAATRTVPAAALRPLLASPARRARTRLASLLDRSGNRPVPALDDPAPSATGWLRGRPGLLLVLGLLAVTLVAVRDLLGAGVLVGGRLLPLPEQLLAGYARTREPAVLLGPLADLLLLGCVPLAGAVAYAGSGRVVRSLPLRLWVAATWALLPVATGAVAAGRLEAALVHVALPALLLGGMRVLISDPRDDGRPPAVAYGLALTPVVALAPVLWVLAVVLLAGAALARAGAASAAQRPAARRRLVSCLLALAVPPLLLLPWSPQLLDPPRLLHGAGRIGPGLADAALPSWHLLLLHPGGPGAPAVLLGTGVLLAAAGGLLRSRRARVAAAGWGVALVGLAAALVLARVTVGGEPVWPGVPVDLLAAGLLLSALIGGEGLQESLARSSFGARQVGALVVVLLAVAAPLVGALDWVRRGAHGPLERTSAAPLPAFVRADLAARPGLRVLLLSPREDGTVGYAVTGPAGRRLGDRPAELSGVVADLLTPRGGNAVEAAARSGIAYVRGTTPLPALDAQPGLERQSGQPLWRVLAPVTPAAEQPAGGLPAGLQALALALAAVLAAPGAAPQRGLVRAPR